MGEHGTGAAATAPGGQGPESLVLVVDDDEATSRLFVRALGRAGIGTRAALNGLDALSIIERDEISVVLLDGRMPGMSGLEVLAAIREMPGGATLPVVFVTGQHELDDRIRGLDAGANDYLTKPVELDELVARVRAQLRAKDAWTGAIDDIEHRLDAVKLLRRIRRSDAAEVTARDVCGELGELDGIDGAAILVVRGSLAVVTLAVHGVLDGPFVCGEPLDESAGPRLVTRLRRGPWIEAAGSDSARWTPVPFAVAGSEHLAVAPLAGPHGLLGALVLAGRRDLTQASPMLSAAIDFAAVVSALISPELERQGSIDDARANLREIIRDHAFVPYFQPIRDITTDVTVGYEALTRWSDGTRPDLRFAEAVALGMDEEVQCATLEAQLAAAEPLDPEAWLSVNVSATIASSGALREVLARTDRSIVLELTEHEPVDDYESLSKAVRALPGVRIAVDDAGAGYSSIRHVLDLRPELVKLDISWVRGLDVDPARQALISGMTGFATEIGCQLIAEGIETDGELRVLRRLGITLGQGYLLGRPAPVETWVTQ